MHLEMEKIDYPIISVMIATYNSEWILERPLKAIRCQTYPQNKLEIMIIDGGSRDNTLKIAQEYGCRVIDNPAKDPASAKRLGMIKANGRYLLSIDHDEVLINPDSIKNRIDALLAHPECKIAFCSGYKCPQGYGGLNEYVSEFGDPFSLFYYRFSKGYKYYSHELSKRAKLKLDNNYYEIYSFDKGYDRVIVEVQCMATIIDLEYFRTIYNEEINSECFAFLFYKMIDCGDINVIISKNDPLEHYSVDSMASYVPKLRWRIINNIYFEDRAMDGLAGRIKQTRSSKYRKYFFLLYTFSVIMPLVDGVYYGITRRNCFFCIHIILCWYIIIYSSYQYIRRFLRRPPLQVTYNGDKLE